MKQFIWLILIVALGAYLRLDRLTSIPPALSHDETAIAYNAYSILKTGKDEYGIRLPLLFRSFDDYKLPGMVYATVPAVALFGLSELSARLPSATFGILSILVIYAIAIEVLGTKRWIKFGKQKIDGALLPTFLFTVSPWHINFSRQLFESNGAVFWFMLGTYFLLRSRRDYTMVLWAGLGYVVALYFYYSVRLVIPFIGLWYLLTQWKTIIKEWKVTLFAASICILVFLPMGKEMLSKGGMERISIVSVVNDPNYLKRKDAYVQKMGIAPNIIAKIVYNRRVALIETVIENYAKNISFHNVFVTGTGTYGTLYPFEILLIPLGFIALFILPKFCTHIVLIWLFCAFLPGAFSVNQPNTLRTLIAAPAFALLSGLGVWYALTLSQKWKHGVIRVASLLILLFILAFPKFHYAYFVNNPTNNALSFGDGYKQMVHYVKTHESAYDRIYISGYYWRPYVFMLYWGNTDPKIYQQGGSREHFGKYYFTSASWDTNGVKLMDKSFDLKTLPHTSQTLFILSKPEYELRKQEFKKIEGINGSIAREVFIAATLVSLK